jgi:hypothetical protein
MKSVINALVAVAGIALFSGSAVAQGMNTSVKELLVDAAKIQVPLADAVKAVQIGFVGTVTVDVTSSDGMFSHSLEGWGPRAQAQAGTQEWARVLANNGWGDISIKTVPSSNNPNNDVFTITYRGSGAVAVYRPIGGVASMNSVIDNMGRAGLEVVARNNGSGNIYYKRTSDTEEMSLRFGGTYSEEKDCQDQMRVFIQRWGSAPGCRIIEISEHYVHGGVVGAPPGESMSVPSGYQMQAAVMGRCL